MTAYQTICTELQQAPKTWLVTGAAGFIGSHLVERLLALGQRVVALDNFSTGHQRNLDEVLERAGVAVRFRFIKGDTRDLRTCRDACDGVDVILHQAALGSIPRSIADPLSSHGSNVDGFINILVAAHEAGVKRFVYASSSSVYGDSPELPKSEARTGRVLSPYAATKVVNELYAWVFQYTYGLETIGLRYFNVFGRRQDPAGPYAAVIPRWVSAMLAGETCTIFGDGETSRDFCYIDNVVQANILAATTCDAAATGRVYNVACGTRTTLKELFGYIRAELDARSLHTASPAPEYRDFRPGDIRHSLADIAIIQERLGYVPSHTVAAGLHQAIGWYVSQHAVRTGAGAARIGTLATGGARAELA